MSVDTGFTGRTFEDWGRAFPVWVWLLAWVGGWFLIVSLLPTLVDAGSQENREKELRTVIEKMKARYQNTKDLQATFVQKTRIEGFDSPLLSHGQVYIKKPGKLRWDYHEPNVEKIYVNHRDVQIYVPEHKQVLVGDLTKLTASQAPLELLQGVADIDKEFNVETTEGRSRGAGGLPLVTLLPKANGQEGAPNMKKVVLELEPSTYFLKTVSIFEPSGNISTFEFTNLRANQNLEDSLFTFQVPQDVEVIEASEIGGP